MSISETARDEHTARVKACLENIDDAIQNCEDGEGTAVLRDLVAMILRIIRKEVKDIGDYVSLLPPNARIQELSTAWGVPASELGATIGVPQSSLEVWLHAFDDQNFMRIIAEFLLFQPIGCGELEYAPGSSTEVIAGKAMLLHDESRGGALSQTYLSQRIKEQRISANVRTELPRQHTLRIGQP